MNPFDHLVLTRFNVQGFLGGAPPDEAWLTHRLGLFERFCLPSVRGQTTKDFRWLVLFDESSPVELRRRIEGFARQVPLIACFVGPYKGLDLARLVKEHTDPAKEFVITTRLDNDDAISRDFLERVQDEFRHGGPEFVNFDRGYVLAHGKLYSSRQPSNPFVSLIEPRETMRTVWWREHKEVAQAAPLRRVVTEPTWLQVVHASNASNRSSRSPRVPVARLTHRFAVEPVPEAGAESRTDILLANAELALERVVGLGKRILRRATPGTAKGRSIGSGRP